MKLMTLMLDATDVDVVKAIDRHDIYYNDFEISRDTLGMELDENFQLMRFSNFLNSLSEKAQKRYQVVAEFSSSAEDIVLSEGCRKIFKYGAVIRIYDVPYILYRE